MQDLREQIAEAIEAAIDNVHDMDVTFQQYAEASADAALDVIRGAVKPLGWRMAHDHWRAASPEGVYSVGDAGGGYAFVSVPYNGGVQVMRVYPFVMGKPVAEALHDSANLSLLAAIGVE